MDLYVDKKEEDEEDSDCYEIVDKTTCSNQENRTAKNIALKRLTRKRRISEEMFQDSLTQNNSTSMKQRRVLQEDDIFTNMEVPQTNAKVLYGVTIFNPDTHEPACFKPLTTVLTMC